MDQSLSKSILFKPHIFEQSNSLQLPELIKSREKIIEYFFPRIGIEAATTRTESYNFLYYRKYANFS